MPIVVTDALGRVTRIGRDEFGRIVSVVDPSGADTAYQWSIDGRLLSRRDPDGATQRWNYDGEGNLVRHEDSLGAETTYTYGDFDLLATRCDPDSAITIYSWDTERRLTSVTNPVGGVWTYRYDSSGRVIEEVDFNGVTTEYAYDVMDRLLTVETPTGTRSHTYDVLGQLSTVSTTAGESRVFDRDLAGRPVDAVSALHGMPIHSLAYEYTADGLQASEIVDGQRPLAFGYDLDRRVISRSGPSGGLIQWQWDPTGQLRTLVADGHPISFVHDASGQLTNWNVHELGVSRAHTPAGQLASQQVIANPASRLNMDFGPSVRPEPTVLRRDDYHYRGDRYLTRHASVTHNDSVERNYTLDPVGRITAVRSPESSEQFVYDDLGNITSGGDGSSRREYRGTLLVRDGRHRYTYDASGRLIQTVTTRLSHKPDVWRYSYDGFDQLTDVTTPDGSTWKYTYDALGRRVTKTHYDITGAAVERTQFVWDGTTLIEQSSVQETTRWTYRPGTHTPLTQSTDSEFYAIVTDLIGTPTDLVNPVTGSVVGSATQSLWGSTTWRGEVSTPLRFPGQYHDGESGFHYNLHRYYNPHTARFVTPDPLGLAPSPNPSAYVHNPTGWIDPLGLTPESCGRGIGDVPFGADVPAESVRVIEQIQGSGVIWDYGVRGADIPRHFVNDGRGGGEILPHVAADGSAIRYREWGTIPSPANPHPGSERIVTGSDGSIYYTPDHYRKFIKWNP